MTSAAGNGPSPEAWLLGEAKAVRGDLAAAVGWSLAAGLMIVLQARLLAVACQRIITGQAGFSATLPFVTGVALAALARGGATLLSERYAVAAAARVKLRTRHLLHQRLLESGPAGITDEGTGALVETLTTGVEGLEPYVGRFLPHLALAALLPLLALLFAFPAEWRSALVLLFSAPFIPLFMILIGRGSEKLNQRHWENLSRMAGHLLDLVRGLPDLKICGAARREAEVVARISGQYRQGTMAVLRVAFLSAFTLEFFATIGTAVVAVVVGFRLLSASLTLADGLFVLLLAPEFYLPLRTLGLSYHSRMQGVAAAGRIAPLLVARAGAGQPGMIPASLTPPVVSFEQVSCRGHAGRGGVNNITLELPATGLIALVGESGAGKTTLARLLAGVLRPESGRITINGVDLSRMDLADWRSRLAWVSQQPFFFKGTIRENLLLGCDEASGDEVRAALDAAAATPFIERLPAGIDTGLGDRGAGLSGGELRRLALARAFLRNALLVVLDEPTAGLDRENERLVGEAIERLSDARCVLLISHREETIARAGRVVLLTAGRVERVMTPAEYRSFLAVAP